ncbi:hypothetical protein NAF17_00770 [Mucilaginibacter sp. RB4R14]|uniref:hypothetical protein n=1 Tax=Mucilaginibacter aurantiaciroseus TaxID=2949308 RepID=UPI00209010F0|nr:hypothetical protein [Mucilaginibacter aurantiaciroseus]MCO5934056.1 hypothetical protein [Mucilaginibacter aurantiaciroseus]
MKSDMENNEWAGDEMSLERFSKETPFTVPSGYFEEAGKRILSLIKLNELKSDDMAQGFAVPTNYFEELNTNIQSRINIEAIAGTEEKIFAVPTGYFDQLTQNIQSRINIETAASSEAENFSVPAGYFDNLQQQITARIAVEELLVKEPAFTVPDNYFEQLNRDILNKTINQEAVIRKTIVRKLWASNTFKYATAACLLLIVGTGAFLREAQQPVTHSQTLLHKQVSNIPVDEIKDYLELNIDANDTRGLMDNDKQINTDALDADLQDYININ